MTTQIIKDYEPESTLRIRKDDLVTRVPWVTEFTAQVLFANAYIRTVGDIAALPSRFPGVARAFAQDPNFKTWEQLFAFAQRVVDTPDGVTVRCASASHAVEIENTPSSPSSPASTPAVPTGLCSVM